MLTKLLQFLSPKPKITSEQLDEKLDAAIVELEAYEPMEARRLLISAAQNIPQTAWREAGYSPGSIFIAFEEGDRQIGRLRANHLELTSEQREKVSRCRQIVREKLTIAKEQDEPT
jgi:hypothetical protein